MCYYVTVNMWASKRVPIFFEEAGGLYVTYECKVCGTIFTLPIECVEWGERNNKYLSCPYGHRKIVELDKYADVEKCMDRDSFKRDKGAIKQTRWDRG